MRDRVRLAPAVVPCEYPNKNDFATAISLANDTGVSLVLDAVLPQASRIFPQSRSGQMTTERNTSKFPEAATMSCKH